MSTRCVVVVPPVGPTAFGLPWTLPVPVFLGDNWGCEKASSKSSEEKEDEKGIIGEYPGESATRINFSHGENMVWISHWRGSVLKGTLEISENSSAAASCPLLSLERSGWTSLNVGPPSLWHVRLTVPLLIPQTSWISEETLPSERDPQKDKQPRQGDRTWRKPDGLNGW